MPLEEDVKKDVRKWSEHFLEIPNKIAPFLQKSPIDCAVRPAILESTGTTASHKVKLSISSAIFCLSPSEKSRDKAVLNSSRESGVESSNNVSPFIRGVLFGRL